MPNPAPPLLTVCLRQVAVFFNILLMFATTDASVKLKAVLNIGADETARKGVCSDVNATFNLERLLAEHIATTLERGVQGWEELLFDAAKASLPNGGLPNNTTIAAWSRHRAADVAAKGFRAIESHNSFFYLNKWGPNHFPLGQAWQDIGENIDSADAHLLLGGEMSMWTDNYCSTTQCGANGKTGTPVGAELFSPTRDAEFTRSIVAMIFPGAAVGAGAFWNFNTSAPLLANSTEFAALLEAHTRRLRARGVAACPVGCTCDEVSQCGEPYIPPPPPGPAPPSPPTQVSTFTRACDPDDIHQLIMFKPFPGHRQQGQQQIQQFQSTRHRRRHPPLSKALVVQDVPGQLVNSNGLCVDRQTATTTAPLNFVPCRTAGDDIAALDSSTQVWHQNSDGSFSQQLAAGNSSDQVCLDSFGLRRTTGGKEFEVGVWPCSGKAVDSKEIWAASNDGKSLKNAHDGRCLSDAP